MKLLRAAALLVCTPVGAYAQTPGDAPALAANASDAERRAWADRYVQPGSFVETDIDADRVYLYDPASFQRQPDGHVVGLIRAELMRPRVVNGIAVRSVRKLAEIDCAALRYKERTVEGFAGSNLARPTAPLPVSDKWTEPATAGSPAGRRLFPACADTATFAKFRAERFAAVKIAPPLVFDLAVGPRMMTVPAGEFRMGEGRGRAVRFDHPLAVSMFPITYGEYSWFVAETRRPTVSSCITLEGGRFEKRAGRDWYNPGFPQVSRSPATCVGYDDAVAYTAWLSQKTGKRYRLLTEAEYEYANRAGTTTAYWWGDDPSGGCAIANGFDQDAAANAPSLKPSACHDGSAFTGALDRPTKPNAFGLTDTTGNVASWTSDCWRADCKAHVVRGGSWASPPQDLRAAARGQMDTGDAAAYIGFRVVREL